jgi:hypothetical protein
MNPYDDYLWFPNEDSCSYHPDAGDSDLWF